MNSIYRIYLVYCTPKPLQHEEYYPRKKSVLKLSKKNRILRRCYAGMLLHQTTENVQCISVHQPSIIQVHYTKNVCKISQSSKDKIVGHTRQKTYVEEVREV